MIEKESVESNPFKLLILCPDPTPGVEDLGTR